MPGTTLTTAVNPHFLARLLTLAGAMPVLVSEDIFEASGERLLVRGTRLAPHHGAVLENRTLRKLLEGCLVAPDAPDADQLVARARQLLATNLPLARIVDSSCGRGEAPLDLLALSDLGHAMRLLLVMQNQQHAAALEHSITVSLLAICMAKKLHLSDDDQRAACLAGLLHDVGELHLDPVCLGRPNQRLPQQEWVQLTSHPRIGQMLVDQLASYSLSVGRAVGEHHERFDGSGYPRAARGHAISAPGQAVSVAEMIAALLYQDHPLERAELALRIVPGEHAPDLQQAISGALRAQVKASPYDHFAGFDSEADQRLYWRITSAMEAGKRMLDDDTGDSPRFRELLSQTLERIATIHGAFLGASGIGRTVVRCEVEWRLRDIARGLQRQFADRSSSAALAAGLAHLLDDGIPAVLTPAGRADVGAPSASPELTILPASQPYVM